MRTNKIRTRRQFVSLAGLLAAVWVAGCTGDGDDDTSADDTVDPGEEDSDEMDDTEEVDDTDEMEDTEEDSDEMDDTEEIDDTDDDEPADDTDDEQPDDTGEVDAQEFFQMVRWDNDYRSIAIDEQEGVRWESRVHGEDSYTRMEQNSEVFESYRIENTSYIVQGDTCTVFEYDPIDLPEEPPDPDDFEDIDEEEPTVTNLGSDEIGDDPVTVYEIVHPDRERMMFYLLGSGYPRRITVDAMTIDFFDWGATEPITPPDMECMEI